jgi:hypothetical protein
MPRTAGSGYLDLLGIKAAYAPPGIVIALTFIGLPFVVRTLEPVLRASMLPGGGRRESRRKPLANVLACHVPELRQRC